ncbi:hypothetical protein [Sphingobacterium spiritivorum]
MKRIQLLIILYLLTIVYYGCRRNDLSLEDEKLVDSSTGNIELLKKAFRSDSIAYNRSGNISGLNFRQSLQRVIYWEYAVIKDKSTYIPVRQLLPEGNLTENGDRFLPHRAWLIIEKDSVNNKFSFKMLTLISEKGNVDYENFDGISLTEDYFSRKAIEAIKYGDDINPSPKLEIIKLMSTGTLSFGSICSPVVSAGKRCGPGLKCEYIKVAYVCTGNYCSDRYEWMCVKNWTILDPDNPEPVNPPYTGPWPEFPGTPPDGTNTQTIPAQDTEPLSYPWRDKLKAVKDFLAYLPKGDGMYLFNEDDELVYDENGEKIPLINSYNCHYYAFGQNNNPNAYIEPFKKILGYPDLSNFTKLNPGERIQVGDRVTYYIWRTVNDDPLSVISHPAIVTQVDANGFATEVSSKMGESYGIITHHPRDIPELYGPTQVSTVFPDGTKKPNRIYYRQK